MLKPAAAAIGPPGRPGHPENQAPAQVATTSSVASGPTP